MRKFLMGGIILASSFCAFALPASATPYSLAINESVVSGSFNDIQAFIFSPDNNLMLNAFSDASYHSVAHGSLWSEFTGNLSSNLNFTINYDLNALPSVYHFYAFSSGNLVDSASFTNNGSSLLVVDPLESQGTAYAADVARATRVPEPLTLSLFAAGLAGLGFLQMRRNKKQQAI